jgi:hypothetical protein
MYQSWVLSVAGWPVDAAGRFGNCGPWIAWLKRRGMWRSAPTPGALVFFDWDGDGRAEHIGMVESVRADKRIVTLEGNANIPGKRDGVYRMVRRSCILGYGHLPYSAPPAQAKVGASAPVKRGPVSLLMPGPVKIAGGAPLGTGDARKMRASQCPMMPRGFGGPESATQAGWAAYWYALMARYSPGYYKQLSSSAAGKREIARREIGPATVLLVEKMLNQSGRLKGSARGVIPWSAWSLYQPG